jgi:UDP-glucose 4-epimerase
MSRILVTGGAGFIGSHLVDALLERGNEILILDDFSSGRRSNLNASAGRFKLLEGDVRDIAARSHEIGPVDAVIHLAARISGHDSLIDPVEYFRVNLEGTQALIDFAGETGASRFLFASSSTVYGNQPEGPIGEDRPPAPLTVYALTKFAGEHLLRMYARLRGFSHCSLRLFNVYGPRQATDHPYANVTCKFSHAAANALPVQLYGDGEQARDFVYVSDVVAAFVAVLEGSRDTIYNVGTGRTASINSLIASLSRIAGAELAADRQPPWPNDIRTICADTGRIRTEFGLEPTVPLEEGLRRTVEYFAGSK